LEANYSCPLQYTSTKGFCDDLREGKFSLPLIHFFQYSNASSTNLVWDFLRNRSGSASGRSAEELPDQMKSWILSQLRDAGSLKYVSDILDRLFQGILDMLDRLEEKRGRNRKLMILVLGMK
jgi:geranylgeranyl diphosphate synthase type 3